jgi:putative phosphoesterase
MTKIAIFSDSHDQMATLRSALAAANAAGAAVLLHCGDLCAPFMLKQIGAARFPQITLHGMYAELEIAGRQIALIHYPEPARRIVQSGQLDLVCYGHDHTPLLERVGRGWLLNPGELLGLQGAPAWAIYDTVSGAVTPMSV